MVARPADSLAVCGVEHGPERNDRHSLAALDGSHRWEY
jgi:hypothetical protein